ncbi:hypothetical protein A9R16_008200 [Acidiferrobacter thiooxydans]|uniref:hypothetical protein n=1 Tax=Acidiferrobacter thiooxydans TaxID=163359 RepID=UPI0009FD644D|nr:hypothetical protein [Acidiferrobacter thiooxydans]MDA8119222.1 hypothetical protein [Gammaproteobacteria bacterium]UEN98428.1 hypothetical protein A9R16_008200 [Acidiferrobacter thiooxydans]
MGHPLRTQLVEAALAWQERYGIAPAITAALSEYDAAHLLGITDDDYSHCMTDRTAVTRGADFVWRSRRYQIKANRPSGAPRSRVTLVPKARNYDWDFLIWILYDRVYAVQEAWVWEVTPYRAAFHDMRRLSPDDYRRGTRLA